MENYVESILEIIKNQINSILNNDSFYKNYRNKVEVSNEQFFSKKSFLEPDKIYIVVKFENANFDIGQILLPITINVASEQNKLDVCQKLLFDFSEQFTLKTIPDDNDFIKQIWNTPNVINNFNEVSYGYRSLLYTTGTIIIGKNSSPLSELYFYVDGNEENQSEQNKINLYDLTIIFSDNFDVDLDSQPFYYTNGAAKSASKTSTYSFSITCFKLNNDFFDLCKMIKRGTTKFATDGVTKLGEDGISTKFKFSFKDKDDNESWSESFRLVNYTCQQNKGDLPVVSLTFSR